MVQHVRDRSVVVGVDGSSSAARAAQWAAVEAQRRGMSLRLVHAYEVPLGYPQGIADPNSVRDAMTEQGWRYLREVRDAVTAVTPDLRIELSVERGPVVPTLVGESGRASQLVLGTRGLNGFTGLLVGSKSVALAGRAHCPLVVVRGRRNGEAPPLDGPVVVGVDGTPTGEAAIEFAFEEASTRGCALIAVHTWTDAVVETAFEGGPPVLDLRPLRQQAQEILAQRLAGWQEKHPEVTVTREVVRDRPARALLHHAETAAMVVVGTRGRGGYRGLILGSTSQHVLHHAPCPVAVVRTDPDN